MQIFDSHLGKKIDFKPLEEGKVGFYLCGPTVYDFAHLGHGRSAVAFDVIRRYFEYKGYDVNFVSNYTDIDDKMIKRADEDGVSVAELAERIIKEYEQDYGDLRVKPPVKQPKATEYIREMIDLIKVLEENGHTYELDDGVYFDVSTFEDYGKFSGQDLEQLQMGARVEVKDAKKNPQDFALWKLAKGDEPYEDYWDSPWGSGRPGWHIECSAMSRGCLGDKFDIHGGGLDLKFPHHECEVAQSRGALGAGTFAQHWMHNGFIQVDNEKMSKSLGNFFTLRDIFKKYDPVVVRFMFLQTHYRNPINFSDVLLENAKARLRYYYNSLKKFNLMTTFDVDTVDDNFSLFEDGYAEVALDEFEQAMDNDFNLSAALASIDGFFDKINRYNGFRTSEGKRKSMEFLEAIDSVFAVFSLDALSFFDPVDKEDVPSEVVELAEERQKARSERDFEASDRLRDEIKALGYLVEDSAEGYSLKKL